MYFLNSEALPTVQTEDGTFAYFADRGIPSLPADFLEALSRRELQDTASYVLTSISNVSDLEGDDAKKAREMADNTMRAIFELNDRMPIQDALDAMTADRVLDICTDDLADDVRNDARHSLGFLLGDHDASGKQFVEPADIILAKRVLVIERLKKTGPALWTDIVAYMLDACEQREEDANLTDLLILMHHEGLVVISTCSADGLRLKWSTAVRLGDWYDREQAAEQSSITQ